VFSLILDIHHNIRPQKPLLPAFVFHHHLYTELNAANIPIIFMMPAMLSALLGGILLVPYSLCIPAGAVPTPTGLDSRAIEPGNTAEIGYCAGLSDPTVETSG
jgi:hypothetical protein